MNKMEVKFDANLDNVIFSRNIGASFLYPLDPNVSFIQEVKTIISEGVTNAIVHGYELNEEKEVTLKMSYDDIYVYIEIIDQGKGIEDIDEAKMPLFTTKANEERSGLGFTIIEVFSDLLNIESSLNNGTTLKIQKKIPKLANDEQRDFL